MNKIIAMAVCPIHGKRHKWQHVENANVPVSVRGQVVQSYKGIYKCKCGAKRIGQVREVQS